MAEIIKIYKQSVPTMRFICKKDPYEGGGWGEWHGKGWFGEIEKISGGEPTVHQLYEDGDAYIGMLNLSKDFNTLGYYIGMFVPLNTSVPEGYISMDYPAQNFGVCWIQGKDMDDIQSQFRFLQEKINEAGMERIKEDDGSFWQFERYGCPRYTNPDENGNIIVDYCCFVK
jgi:predicted transcriptional regulator YdeE